MTIDVGGEPLALGPEEIEVAVDAAPGFAAAGSKVGVLVLALELTDALKEEGLAREIAAKLQQSRKDAGLSFTDLARVTIAGDEAVLRVVEKEREMLEREVMLASLTVGEGAPSDGAARELSVDGLALRVWLQRA